jgi:hypothetical protein
MKLKVRHNKRNNGKTNSLRSQNKRKGIIENFNLTTKQIIWKEFLQVKFVVPPQFTEKPFLMTVVVMGSSRKLDFNTSYHPRGTFIRAWRAHKTG